MRRGRKPRPDELDLWRQVARNYTRHEKPEATSTEFRTTPQPGSERRRDSVSVPEISGGKAPLRNDIAPTLAQSLAGQPVRMDHKAYRKLQRGRVKPEARLDLHGMTLDRAHAALVRFVMTQNSGGKRLLLVITGKGKRSADDGPIPVRFGALRHQVPEWLRLPPLAGVVLQVTPAHPSHGGDGAYYVYLRKSR